MKILTDDRERQVQAREQAAADLAAVNAENVALHEQLLARAQERGVAEERARLSREIHDTVAQGLVGVITQLESVPDDLPPPVGQRIDRAEMAAKDCLTEARRAVRALAPRQLRDGMLTDAVRDLAAAGAPDLEIELVTSGAAAGTDHDAVALRVVQESVSNARRHSRSYRVTITLSWLPDALLVDVCDDGIGFDPDRVTAGHGLSGMAVRVRRAGGRLAVESVPGHGTTVSAVLPR